MAQDGQAGTLDWGKFEGEILGLFVSQNKTLNEVMAHMTEKHNFQATARQYKSRFPNLKNVKAEEWIWIDQEMQRRAALGKESEPYLHNRPLPADRVVREIARHKNKVHPAVLLNQVPNPSPGRISVRTPPPMAAIASGPNLSPLDDVMGNHEEIHAFQAYGEALSIRQSPLDVAFEQEQLNELDTAMEFEPEIQANFSHLDLSSGWDFDGNSDFDWATVYRLSPALTTKQNPGFGASGYPRPQSGGQRLSPFSQFINLEIFDTRPGFHLMADLPWFRLQSMLEQSEYISIQLHPVLDGVLLSPTSTYISLPPEARRGVLSSLLGLKLELQLTENIAKVMGKLQRLMPERYEGELSDKVGQILEGRSSGPSNLFSLFGLAAYFASNNALGNTRTDTFLKWTIDQTYTDYLVRFLQINTSTIHAFAAQILRSAARTKNVKFLTALLDHDIKLDRILDDIFSIGDVDLTKLVISRFGLTHLNRLRGIKLFHRFVVENHFDLAWTLVENGVSVDCQFGHETPLYNAVSSRNFRSVRFLLSLGADVNRVLPAFEHDTVLGRAAYNKDLRIFSLLVEHGANTSCRVGGKDLLEWSSLNCRNIYGFLKGKVGSIAVGVTIGDLVDAANQSTRSLRAYISNHEGQVSKRQLEGALSESIRLEHLTATLVLLQHGVSPDCYTLNTRPLLTALDSEKQRRHFCELLIMFKADVNVPGILNKVIQKTEFELLQLFVMSGVDLEEQGMEALVKSAKCDKVMSAAFLLDSGVDINTPGLKINPLQVAAAERNLVMVEFLLIRGANINAPAYPDGGRTALQSALNSGNPLEVAGLLLDKGADIFAPPALVGGITALEAICCGWSSSDEGRTAVINRLLDAGAPANRPNGKPTAALHGVIEQGLDGILARILEPQRNAIINYMWCDEDIEEDVYYTWEPRTPTQLAADRGRLEAVRMLLDRGADINEAPAYRFGRTALQAATSSESPDMELVQFLLEKGADVNATPAVHGGITALQGAAISGDIMLAKLLLDKGADVNAAPSFIEGRYAIEGAAEHGRLDTVQLLLNAGARGNVFHRTGFEYAIELAEENGHFAIADVLRTSKNKELGV